MKPMNTQFSHDELTNENAQRAREAVHAAVAEATGAVLESAVHRSAAGFTGSVEACTEGIASRRAELEPESNKFYGASAEAIAVAETGFRNGRTAALRARPGEDPGAETIEGAAHGIEANARQYTGHVPDVVYHGDAELCSVEHLWDVYERSVSAGIRSIRRAPFGEDGPVAYDTADRGFNIDELLRDRLQVQPRSDGRRAYDAAVPAAFVESVRELAPEGVHVASHFVYSYAGGSMGVPLPYTVMGVELLRALGSANGTHYDEPERVVNLVRE